jgi:polar amino acid transport system substrate-binding protein
MWRPFQAISNWLAALVVALPILSPAWADTGHTLHVAAYDAAPYAARNANGLYWGASVDLWRRVAEDRHWTYDLTLVASMEDIVAGVADGRYDVAIGAITITPDRLAHIAFSYPSHRSGVAVAMARQSGFGAFLAQYGAVANRLGVLVALMFGLLLVTGVLIWLFERRAHRIRSSETSIGNVFEGLYWAVVTMTTVGYGDKAPHTYSGRAVAVLWMLGSLVLISLLSTSLVAQLTVDQLADTAPITTHDLAGLRRAAAANSSGAEFLTAAGLRFQTYDNLEAALAALAAHQTDAVVNSVGALQWAVANGFSRTAEVRAGLLAPALMGFALQANSPLLVPLDEALVRITSSEDWAAREKSYFTN